jgi:hypothetical protein
MAGNRIDCPTCPLCGLPSYLELDLVTAERVRLWLTDGLARPLVQDAFPELSLDQREQLLTGAHGECFETLLPHD